MVFEVLSIGTQRANPIFPKFRPFAGRLQGFQLIIVQNILGQGGRWPPGQQAIGAISSFQRGGDEGRWGINITIIYGAPPKAPNPNIGAVPPISQFCQLLGVCV